MFFSLVLCFLLFFEGRSVYPEVCVFLLAIFIVSWMMGRRNL